MKQNPNDTAKQRPHSVVSPVKKTGTKLTFGLASLALAVGFLSAPPELLAQGFQWPWATETKPRPRPAPRGTGFDDPRGWAPAGDICLQLEQRLVQESKSANRGRDQIPALSEDIRNTRRAMQAADSSLEQKNCYSYFLFSKTLKRTRRCIKLANDRLAHKRRLAELEIQLQQINSSSGRSYQDDIIRELARNGCGENYVRQARRRDQNPFSSLWQDDESTGYDGALGRYNSALPYATYRTLCVRLCDGYYFPISFSTLPNHFGRDAERCQSKCAAPAQLFYYQNPGGAVEQMVSTQGNQLYTDLKTAFRYRKEYVKGCSCKMAEYSPNATDPAAVQRSDLGQAGPSQSRTPEGPAIAEGWSAQTQPR
ncbi:MAG: DUF2865 domain-containing protein [Alphaproteobacteria bacterium]|nr:DUF2865 domain-containing protein [Alphaproteobacteria bacterium]